jgi:hypothetical protein
MSGTPEADRREVQLAALLWCCDTALDVMAAERKNSEPRSSKASGAHDDALAEAQG